MKYGSAEAAVETKYENALLKLFGNIIDAHMLLAQEDDRTLDSSQKSGPRSGVLYSWELRDASETLHDSVTAARQAWHLEGSQCRCSELYDKLISLGSRTVADLEELI